MTSPRARPQAYVPQVNPESDHAGTLRGLKVGFLKFRTCTVPVSSRPAEIFLTGPSALPAGDTRH